MRLIFLTVFAILLGSCSNASVQWDSTSAKEPMDYTYKLYLALTSDLTMATSDAIDTSGSKKATAWKELPIATRPGSLVVVGNATASFEARLNSGVNLTETCASPLIKYFAIYFRIDVSTDNGATYTSHVSEKNILLRGAIPITFRVDGVRLKAGDVLTHKTYLKIEEYSYVHATSSCLTAFFGYGTMDLRINEPSAIQLPDQYHYDWANGPILHNDRLTFTKTDVPTLTVDPNIDAYLYSTPWIDIPIHHRVIQFNDKSLVRPYFSGTFSWTGCTVDTTTNVPPGLEARFVSVEGKGTVTRSNGIVFFTGVGPQNFTLSGQSLLNTGDPYEVKMQVRVIQWISQPLSTSCVQTFTIDGTMQIENFPRLTGNQ